MLAEELAPQRFVILSYDLDQAVRILGMISDQFGQHLDLAFQTSEPPVDFPHIALLRRSGRSTGGTARSSLRG